MSDETGTAAMIEKTALATCNICGWGFRVAIPIGQPMRATSEPCEHQQHGMKIDVTLHQLATNKEQQ